MATIETTTTNDNVFTFTMPRIPAWGIEQMTGYKPITTFWEDYSIADKFGLHAVLDTFVRAFRDWHGNYKYMTEMYMVLNHKIWQHYDAGNYELQAAYDKLYHKLYEYCCENFNEEEMDYFYRITD